MFNKDTKSTYAGAMKVLVALLAFSVVSIAAMRLYTPASNEGTTESVSSDNTFKSSTLTDVSNAAMAPLACTNTSQYGSATAPTAPCVEVNFTTCQYEGEYAVMSGAVAGTTYTFSAGVATTYITVRSGTYNGAVVAEGVQPLDATPTVSGTLYVHFNTNASCGTGSSCMVTSVACKSCTPPPATYCAVTSTGNTSYGIKNVTTTGGVGNINNTTGSGNYTDYTTQFVSAQVGTPVDFSVSPVINSTFGYAIWVDWNNNKCFEASEKKASAGYISGNFTGTLNIPAGTAPGDYRMRVVNNYLSGAPTACGNLGSNGYGEAEDYTFRVLGATGGPVPCNIDYKYSLVNGYGNTQTLLFADDFEVGANTDMTVEKVTFRLYNDIAMATDIRFYTDNAGTPGTVVKAYTNVVPSAKNFLGTNFGLNFYDMVFTLPTTTTLSTGKYWVAIKTAGGSGVNYWVTTDVGINNPGKYTSNNGVTWIQNSGAANLSFKLDGKCLDTSAGGGIECLLVCSNNQTITLAPGTCEANVNYLVTTVGPKCTQSKQGPVTKTSQITTTPANVDDGLRCGAAGLTGWHSRAYPAFSEDYTMTGIDVMAWNGGQQKIKVFAYTGAMGGQFLDKTKMTQLYESPFFNVSDFQITHYDFPTPVVIPANTNFVIEQSSPAGSYLWHIASTYTNQTAKSYIACSATANPEDYGVWMGGYSYIHLYQVLYGSLSTPGITIEQTKGLPSGSIFPVGTTTNCFRLINADGDAIDSCCFDITINKYPNPSKTLVCNDFLYISADDKCQVNLNADMFLEGGPYACYSDYIIKVDGAVIQQNVPLNIPLGVHQYEITDPATGNRCWGNFKVEDKLAPTLACSCEDKDILEPVTSYAGQIKETDPLFDRCNFVSPYNPMYYTTQKFQVSTNGTYSFQLTTNWTTAYYIYESNLFDPTNPCNNVLASLEVTFIPIPPMNATLQAGKTYVLVATTMWNYDLYAGLYPLDFSFAFSGPGDVLFVQNASDAPECQFKCYDLETVKAETVSMLYKFPGEQNKAVLTIPPAVTEACGGVDRSFVDRVVSNGMCEPTKLRRTWTFTDASGNKASCTQTFTFGPLKVTDLTVPEKEVHMSCGQDVSPADVAAYFDVDSRPQPSSATNIGAFYDDWAQTPSVVELQEGHKYGFFTYPGKGYDGNFHAQKVDNAVCNIFVSYTDQMLPACGLGCSGNMKVIRTWNLLDWCTGDVYYYIQVIKAVDEKAPTFDVKDVTVSVDPWECSATWVVDQPWELQDNCAKPQELKWGVYAPDGTILTGKQPNYVIAQLPKGRHAVEYWAEDCCGNRTTKIAYVTVVDATAPVAIAKQNIVLSLTGGNTSGDGIAKLFAVHVDNGSYDQCSDVKLEIRRLDGGACQNIGKDGKYNNNATYNDHNGLTSATPGVSWLHPDDNVNDSDGGNYVKFCCDDIPQGEEFGIHQVELRVWDDGNMNGIIGDNFIVNGVKDNYNTTWADIRVENKIPPQIVCPPDVTVTCDMVLNLSIGVDTWIDTVDLTMTGYPKSIGICNGAKVTYKDAGNLDDCNRGTITRTFTATIGGKTAICTHKITVGYIQVPFTVTFPSEGQISKWEKCSFELSDARNSNDPKIKKPIVNYGQCDIVGENIKIDTFLFEDGACKKWKVSYTYKNWCTGEEKGPYVYYYAFKDVIAPELVCTDKVFPATPPSPQNPLGGCEGSVVLTSTASDALVCAEESWIKWQVFFDGWSNGTVDRLGSSFVNKAWKDRWEKVDRFINGAPNPVWTALQAQHPGVVLADPVYVTYIKPTKASGEEVKLPAFTLPAENIEHKVLWKVTDGCGNVDQCNSTVKVVDQKAPTPYCVHISTAIMQTNPKMVELWAKDFDKGAFDNCTPQNKLYFTFDEIYPVFSKLNQEHYFKAKAGQKEGVDATLTEYNQGKAQKWIPSLRSSGKIWTSAGVTNIKVSVWDESWNTDFCEVELKIIDNGPGSRASISGTIATASGEGVSNATVTMDAPVIEYPKSVNTDINGNYVTNDNPLTLNYTVNASKGGDYVNGVTTLDIVIIQRHILGMESLNDNYKVIAADANNDSRITAQDLSELRKLILGVTNRFGNESWRFPVAGAVVNTSPIAYSEEIQIDGLSGDVFGQNFVAVKIGDVNGSVDLSAQGSSVEARSNDKVSLSIAEANVAAGELITIPVTASNFVNVSGFQYTMNLNGASFVSIEKGALDMSTANVGNLGNGVVTMSYAGSEGVTLNEGEVLFTMVVRGDKASKVSEIFSLTSAVTKAESYNGDLKVGAINLEVRTAPVTSIELYQNEPNPFKGQTTVSFMMPEAGAATLSVYDMTGKLVVTRSISAVKGLNSEVFTKDQLGVSGVMYYTLESGDFTATKKMIIVE